MFLDARFKEVTIAKIVVMMMMTMMMMTTNDHDDADDNANADKCS